MSNILLPVLAFKDYAVTNSVSSAAATGTGNPLVTWNFNQTWGYAALSGITTYGPGNPSVECFICPSNPNPGDITLTSVRTNLTTGYATVGAGATVASQSIVPVFPTPPLTTFTGDTISLSVAYGNLNSTGAILAGNTEVPNGVNVYLNLANLYITFDSSIC